MIDPCTELLAFGAVNPLTKAEKKELDLVLLGLLPVLPPLQELWVEPSWIKATLSSDGTDWNEW